MGLVFGDGAVGEAKPRSSTWSNKGRVMMMCLTRWDTRSQEPEKKGTKSRLEGAWPGRQEEMWGKVRVEGACCL